MSGVLGGDVIWMRAIGQLGGQRQHLGSQRAGRIFTVGFATAPGRERHVERAGHGGQVFAHGRHRLAVGVAAHAYDERYVRDAKTKQKPVFRGLGESVAGPPRTPSDRGRRCWRSRLRRPARWCGPGASRSGPARSALPPPAARARRNPRPPPGAPARPRRRPTAPPGSSRRPVSRSAWPCSGSRQRLAALGVTLATGRWRRGTFSPRRPTDRAGSGPGAPDVPVPASVRRESR